jgi:hypothetical protein
MTICHSTSSSAWRSGWTNSCGPDEDLRVIRSPWLHLLCSQSQWRWALHVCLRQSIEKGEIWASAPMVEKGVIFLRPALYPLIGEEGTSQEIPLLQPMQDARSPLLFCELNQCVFLSNSPKYPSPSLPLELIDSRAAGNLLVITLDTAFCIPLVSLQSPIPVRALDSCPKGTGLVHHITVPISLLTHETHLEQIAFFIIDTTTHPVVLGLLWLSWHNPGISRDRPGGLYLSPDSNSLFLIGQA